MLTGIIEFLKFAENLEISGDIDPRFHLNSQPKTIVSTTHQLTAFKQNISEYKVQNLTECTIVFLSFYTEKEQ